MASTYSTRISLEKQADGENPNTWGSRLNENVIELVDEAIAGFEVVSVTGPLTLTATQGTTNQARNFALQFAGTLTADTTVTIPAQEKTYFVNNNTSGDYTLFIKPVGGTAVSVVDQGLSMMMATNGITIVTQEEVNTDIVALKTELAALSATVATSIEANTSAITVANTRISDVSASTSVALARAIAVSSAITTRANEVSATAESRIATVSITLNTAINNKVSVKFATSAATAAFATSATNASNINITATGSSGSYRMVFAGTNDSSGLQPLFKDSALDFYYNPSSNQLNVGSLVASGDVTAFSDKRLKDNIETLDGSKVFEMRGVSFTKDGRNSSGVIAQEIEVIAPELVHTDNEYKSVAYGNLVGYLIEAIKILKKEINELKEIK